MTKSNTTSAQVKKTLQLIIAHDIKASYKTPEIHALARLGYISCTPVKGGAWSLEVTPRGHGVVKFSRNQAARREWVKATR